MSYFKIIRNCNILRRSFGSNHYSIDNKNLVTMSVFDNLKFDNSALRRLPIDKEDRNFVRTVNGACFSRINPTPLKNPKLVAVSIPALKLLDIEEDDSKSEEFVEYFCGNKLMPGSETYSQCYCGHQFGTFAGQLGDGAAIYLGEIINKKDERWELQLKGAGLTPYSRDADGRKVLRSSIREFLCSEAMHHLGIPTTRAGSCITSDDTVIRDIFYDGHPQHEKCTVISRIAQSFLRFGSFEIFKLMDPETGRRGPSLGRNDILKDLADYSIEMLYPNIHNATDDPVERYKMFYKEVVLRTAKLVALWQSVGFCHGVLNTDNMSIVGLTLDYGPFGFLDIYNPDHICNSSDDGGRYSYSNQPKICAWNLFKFSEALSPLVPKDELTDILEAHYSVEYEKVYHDKMKKKLGLLKMMDESENDILSDFDLLKKFFETLESTGSDFTNCFRLLSSIDLPGLPSFDQSMNQTKLQLLAQSSSLENLKEYNNSRVGMKEMQLFLLLTANHPEILGDAERGRQIFGRVIDKIEKDEVLDKMTQEEKSAKDDKLWSEWLESYKKRLEHDSLEFAEKINELEEKNNLRKKIMNENNPKFILRNHLAQNAITAAEQGDFSEVTNLLKILEHPYDEEIDLSKYTRDKNIEQNYDAKPPNWACKLKVSCSS